jgi:hypothetical protein
MTEKELTPAEEALLNVVFELEYKKKNGFVGAPAIAKQLWLKGSCVVPAAAETIWLGNVGNYIRASVAPGAVGCVLLTLRKEELMSSSTFKEPAAALLADLETQLETITKKVVDMRRICVL